MKGFTVSVLAALFACVYGGHTNISGIPPIFARIKNGEKARDGEFPYQVSLQINNGVHWCGATILNNEWVLTAAHCVDKANMPYYKVRVGTNYSPSGGSVHSVVAGAVHEKYSGHPTHFNDIAVLKVSPPISMNTKVQPVRLAQSGVEPEANAISVAVGWGASCMNGAEGHCPTIPDLQKVNLKVYSKQMSEKVFGTNTITAGQVCAGATEHKKGVCSGDSGGPLFVGGTQVGISSYTSAPCGDWPGVFTKVSNYRDWIRSKTGM